MLTTLPQCVILRQHIAPWYASIHYPLDNPILRSCVSHLAGEFYHIISGLLHGPPSYKLRYANELVLGDAPPHVRTTQPGVLHSAITIQSSLEKLVKYYRTLCKIFYILRFSRMYICSLIRGQRGLRQLARCINKNHLLRRLLTQRTVGMRLIRSWTWLRGHGHVMPERGRCALRASS